MNRYRFILEPYKGMSTRYKCPNCRKKTFTRYIDTEADEHINDEVGKCDRIVKCAYSYTPKQYFRDNNISSPNTQYSRYNTQHLIVDTKPTSYIDKSILNSSINGSNNFIEFLDTKLFGTEITKEVVEYYKIGTSKHWQGATVFWQIDELNNVRTGKIMLYDKDWEAN